MRTFGAGGFLVAVDKLRIATDRAKLRLIATACEYGFDEQAAIDEAKRRAVETPMSFLDTCRVVEWEIQNGGYQELGKITKND